MWQMGGSGNPRLWDAFGLTEADVAIMAIEGIHVALEKAATPEDFILELESEFVVSLQERMGVDLYPEGEKRTA